VRSWDLKRSVAKVEASIWSGILLIEA